MKSIENKTTEIKQEDALLTYAGLLQIVVKQPKQGGYGIDDLTNRLAIIHVLDSANGTIELEDAHYKYIKPLVEKMTWNVLHKDLLTFTNDILSVK